MTGSAKTGASSVPSSSAYPSSALARTDSVTGTVRASFFVRVPADLKGRCLSPKAVTRTICRWEHEDVLERHRARVQGAADLMRRRSGIVEHPFGTLKCRAGYRHFLVGGFNKVRGEWSLMALCYNFTRVLNILGFEGLVAAVVKALLLRKSVLAAVLDALLRAIEPLQTQITPWISVDHLNRPRSADAGFLPSLGRANQQDT
jgi:hypothetical protein